MRSTQEYEPIPSFYQYESILTSNENLFRHKYGSFMTGFHTALLNVQCVKLMHTI